MSCSKLFFGLIFSASVCMADEGMWQPHQLPELGDKLISMGLQVNPETLSSLTEFPSTAIVSLGGCSASFVSPKGLVVTNHHCVYGSVQFNSTAENNLLVEGFLAKTLPEEVPAAPGTKVYVTQEVTDVTGRVLAGVTDALSGGERYDLIEANSKALIASCEKTDIHRCSVPSFHHGMEYFLVKQLEIRDIRLVYAPATNIGKYGGDTDNWMWPRHTGDFGFYRAYVGQDGKPADYSTNNIPYKSTSYLKVSVKPLKEGDFVMAMGYPGRTNRYRTAAEVEKRFTWFYPTAREMREGLMAVIHNNSEAGSPARISYESTYAGLANYAKNYQSMVEGYSHSDFLQRRQAMEKELDNWISADATRSEEFGPAILKLGALVDESQATLPRDLVLGYMRYAALPRAASRLYRLANEKQKPDEKREPGYQERDTSRFEQSLKRITRRYNAGVEKAILLYMLEHYAALPENQRVASIDNFFKLNKGFNEKKTSKLLDRLYRKTKLNSEEVRLAWMNKSVADFNKSKDPLIQYAVATYNDNMAIELQEKDNDGNQQLWRARYMAALIAFNRSQGKPIYADANSTLRITFGQILGNQPRDGLHNNPFTSVEGIVEKHTGMDPFNSPEKQLALIKNKRYGKYKMDSINSVPVNFLTTVDITGGNSGSATLNGNAELIGLLFDGVYESIIGDWDFDDDKNRAISVDTRYMLWVMEYLDGATNLIDEMDVVR